MATSFIGKNSAFSSRDRSNMLGFSRALIEVSETSGEKRVAFVNSTIAAFEVSDPAETLPGCDHAVTVLRRYVSVFGSLLEELSYPEGSLDLPESAQPKVEDFHELTMRELGLENNIRLSSIVPTKSKNLQDEDYPELRVVRIELTADMAEGDGHDAEVSPIRFVLWIPQDESHEIEVTDFEYVHASAFDGRPKSAPFDIHADAIGDLLDRLDAVFLGDAD